VGDVFIKVGFMDQSRYPYGQRPQTTAVIVGEALAAEIEDELSAVQRQLARCRTLLEAGRAPGVPMGTLLLDARNLRHKLRTMLQAHSREVRGTAPVSNALRALDRAVESAQALKHGETMQ
jgi:hypothetical protein